VTRVSQSLIDGTTTGLLVIDPYNDFISEGGKVWDRVRTSADRNDCIPHMLAVLEAARTAGLRISYALHHRYRPGDYETWDHMAPVQERAWRRRTFEYGTWGGELRAGFEPQAGDIVAQEHWCSSGFANTDLDQQLTLHGIRHVIVIGLLTNTCVEATVRHAAELGYQATVVTDATASLSPEEVRVSLEFNLPNYATLTTTADIVAALSCTRPRSGSARRRPVSRGRCESDADDPPPAATGGTCAHPDPDGGRRERHRHG
jgi:nicotinamidase-related amidase